MQAKRLRKKDDPWMSLPAAQRALGEGRHTILTRALRGEVETQQIAGRVFVARKSVERLLASKAEDEGAA